MDELRRRYEALRKELDAAYAAAVWDSERIDRIAEMMLPLERGLAVDGAMVPQSRNDDE